MKHNSIEYELEQISIESDATPSLHDREPPTELVWVYRIDNDNPYFSDSIESDEYYTSYDEAHEACINHIERLCDGPDEPDYDAIPYGDKSGCGYVDWDERRKLGE